MNDSKLQLSRPTIALHWIIAWTMIIMLAMGIFMAETETYALYDLHKSIGVLIFFVILVRVVWRLRNGWLEPVSQYTPTEILLSKIVHYVLLIGSVIIPISGFMMSAAGGHGVAVFGLELVAANPDPLNPQKVIALNETLAGIGHELHEIVSYLVIVALILHIVGALKHHIIDKDGTLRRILGKPL